MVSEMHTPVVRIMKHIYLNADKVWFITCMNPHLE